jgi:hypothetical protein
MTEPKDAAEGKDQRVRCIRAAPDGGWCEQIGLGANGSFLIAMLA